MEKNGGTQDRASDLRHTLGSFALLERVSYETYVCLVALHRTVACIITPFENSLVLWDAIFAEDLHPPLHIVDYICLVMLLRIRESLLDSDCRVEYCFSRRKVKANLRHESLDSTFLHGLLRYPLPTDGDPRVLLIVQQASYLRDNPTNFGGAYVRRQNQQLGAEAGLKTGTRAEEAMYDNNRRVGTPSQSETGMKQTNTSTAALIDQGRSIAEGLYGKAEALGINKAVFSALGDLKVSLLKVTASSMFRWLNRGHLFQKSVQSYQAQQASSNLSEIPTTPSWEIDAARNRGIDLRRLRNENLAMGNALDACLRIIQAESQQSGLEPSASLSASLRTIEHVKDVLTAKKAHFDAKYADELVGIASQNLLDRPAGVTSSSASIIPAIASVNLLDDTSPTMQAHDTFTPVQNLEVRYPIAPPRTPSVQKHTDDNHMPLAPPPAHNHHFVTIHATSSDINFPDLGEWQSSSDPLSHPIGGMPILPRLPPTSRSMRVQENYRQPLHGRTPLDHSPRQQARSNTRNQAGMNDPLGAFF